MWRPSTRRRPVPVGATVKTGFAEDESIGDNGYGFG